MRQTALAICVAMCLVGNLAGCSNTRGPREYVVSWAFTTLPPHPIAMEEWEEQSADLLYLAQMNDPHARSYAWRVIPEILRWAVQYKETDWLLMALYDTASLEGLDRCSAPDAATVIWRYDRLQPLDWRQARAGYLAQHPDVSDILASLHATVDGVENGGR